MEAFTFVLFICYFECNASYFRTAEACAIAAKVISEKRPHTTTICAPLGAEKKEKGRANVRKAV